MTSKTTHSLEQVEALMWKESNILMDPNVGKEAKNKAKKKLKLLEKHFHDCKDKELNGKTYPERMQGFPDDKPMDKTELLRLIDSVETPYHEVQSISEYAKELEGIFPPFIRE